MIISQDHGRRLPSVLLSAIRQDSNARPVAWSQPLIAAALTRGRKLQPRFAGLHGDPARLVILCRAVSVRSMSSPSSALRDLEELQRRKIKPLVVELCRLRRISTLRSTRQDAQINCLSTLSIFMKQTTYLATLPNPKI
jgi:hypothetical protein